MNSRSESIHSNSDAPEQIVINNGLTDKAETSINKSPASRSETVSEIDKKLSTSSSGQNPDMKNNLSSSSQQFPSSKNSDINASEKLSQRNPDDKHVESKSENMKESVTERVKRLTSYSRPSYPRSEKFTEGTIIELNTADTTVLKKIPGIGSAFAKRIVNYRNLLGGYYSVTQLSEVYGIDEERYNALKPWFIADPSLVFKLDVNKLSQDSLRRHPYINYGQSKVITQLRRQKGRLKGWENLQLLDEFTDSDKIRLLPYLSFD
ncbi:MAG: helix-hairpin-helix domain-containing protein [Tannerella sp.]|nr:helix-hairpin-helix domain-containing protein [Tannerella sp.]